MASVGGDIVTGSSHLHVNSTLCQLDPEALSPETILGVFWVLEGWALIKPVQHVKHPPGLCLLCIVLAAPVGIWHRSKICLSLWKVQTLYF